MNRNLLSIFVPPLAVCRYGCAGCCAAPIAVFWLAGIVGIVYGYLGGPAELAGISWFTVALGVTLWGIATIWTMTTIGSINSDNSDPRCEKKASTVCRIVKPSANESDPFDEVQKFQ